MDTRPPPSWLVPPEGAVACHAADGSTDSPTSRSYVYGDDPSTAFELWKGVLREQRWVKEGAQEKDEREQMFARGEQRLRLFCSSKVAWGWCTVDLRQ